MPLLDGLKGYNLSRYLFKTAIKYLSLNISGSCDCPEAYVFAAKVVADKQGAVLGKYLKSGVHNNRPYYVKTAEKNKKYYLQYQLNGIDQCKIHL